MDAQFYKRGINIEKSRVEVGGDIIGGNKQTTVSLPDSWSPSDVQELLGLVGSAVFGGTPALGSQPTPGVSEESERPCLLEGIVYCSKDGLPLYCEHGEDGVPYFVHRVPRECPTQMNSKELESDVFSYILEDIFTPEHIDILWGRLEEKIRALAVLLDKETPSFSGWALEDRKSILHQGLIEGNPQEVRTWLLGGIERIDADNDKAEITFKSSMPIG